MENGDMKQGMDSQSPDQLPQAYADTSEPGLAELRRLLFAEELRTIHELSNREAQLKALGRDLPQILDLAHEKNKQALNKALQEPVLSMMRQAAHNDMPKVAEALSPVILPAIGQAVQNSLRDLNETIDRTLAHSFSAEGLRWRMEAWRTGETFASVVLRNTLHYRIEQAFLIQTETGLLLAHEAHPSVAVQDADAVSAMLTAIRDFSSQTFAQNSGSTLDSVEIGEHTLWLLSGRTSYLALVIRGILPLDIREKLQQQFAEMQSHYHATFAAFAGDRRTLPDCSALLQSYLLSATEQTAAKPIVPEAAKAKPRLSGRKMLGIALLLGMVAWLAYGAVQKWRENALREQFLTACRETPGLWVVDAREVRDKWQVRVLRDPLATSPQKIASEMGMTPADVSFDVLFVQSMVPEMIVARAAQLFKAPPTVTFTLKQGVLYANGSASWEWKQQFLSIVPLPAGVDRVDVNGVRADAWAEAEMLLQELQAISIEFEQDRQFAATAQGNLSVALRLVKRLVQLDQRMGLGVEIALVGSSMEDSPLSSALRRARSDLVLAWFVRNGVPAGFFLPVANVGMAPMLPGVRGDRVSFEVTFRQGR